MAKTRGKEDGKSRRVYESVREALEHSQSPGTLRTSRRAYTFPGGESSSDITFHPVDAEARRRHASGEKVKKKR